MERNSDYVEIDLLHILHILWKRIWALALSAVIFAVAAFIYAAFIVNPSYQAKLMLYVNNSSISLGSTSFSISSADLTAAQSLVDTYIVILNTRTVLNEVIDEAKLPYSYEELKSMISAQAENGTEVFSVTVTSNNPNEAKVIANTIAKVLPHKVANIVDGASMRIVDYAVTPQAKSAPSITKYVAIGALLGLVLSAAIVIVIDFLDDTVHNPEILRQDYPNIPILASIPDFEEPSKGGYYSK